MILIHFYKYRLFRLVIDKIKIKILSRESLCPTLNINNHEGPGICQPAMGSLFLFTEEAEGRLDRRSRAPSLLWAPHLLGERVLCSFHKQTHRVSCQTGYLVEHKSTVRVRLRSQSNESSSEAQYYDI